MTTEQNENEEIKELKSIAEKAINENRTVFQRLSEI